ncbi:ArdC family protein [Acidicapsa acidisoli]|uniref:ArdC family protein n=1 Tax=Acidicapsa acidisoli TaxID=1615681 RepID=UPI0021E0A0B8|nr:zincin-like metallopeptidase domain-containing protein [Acidicapsa acidisoli]
MNPNDKPPPRDFRAEVTADIIKLLEHGAAPWQKPWEDVAGGGMPFNPTTQKPYRGGNVLALMISEMQHGFSDPRWMTYKQAAEEGWQVRKGERGSKIEFWEAKAGSKDPKAADDERQGRLIHRVYTVFNAQQIDGIPQLPKKERQEWEACEAGEKILKDAGAEIRYGGGRAYYRKDTDHIQLPPREIFKDAPGFYGTACHELIHWTGGEKRLNRETLMKSKGMNADDENYPREELVAEIGSMMLGVETGIPHDPSQHAAYVQSWIKSLKSDKNEIFRAASAASKACDLLLQRGKLQEVLATSHVDRLAEELAPQLAALR